MLAFETSMLVYHFPFMHGGNGNTPAERVQQITTPIMVRNDQHTCPEEKANM